MRVLITGGAGFIGSNLVRHTLRAYPDAQVTVLDALTYAGHRASLAGVLDDIQFVEGSVQDAALVDQLVGELTGEDDLVIHLAAESHNDRSIADPEPFVQTNIVGTFTLLEAVRRHRVRLHHVSTDEVYGDLPLDLGSRPEGFHETDPYRPSSPYAATKAGADHLVSAWIRTYGIEATISNCTNNYGPYQHVEKFLPQQITRVLCGRPAAVYGRGENIRDWIHVEDHCSAIWAVIERGKVGTHYGVSSGNQLSNVQVIAELQKVMGQFDVLHVADRPGHDQRLALDGARTRDELGWRPVHQGFRQGLSETVDWYREHREWWRPLMSTDLR